MSDEAIVARLARIETEIATMREENRTLRRTLHDMISRSLAEHSVAIGRLAAAHDQRIGVWTAAVALGAVLLVLIGGGAWLLEHNIQIVVKP